MAAGGGGVVVPPPEAVVSLLEQALDPQTAQAAGERVKLELKSGGFVLALLLQSCGSPRDDIRQLAAVLARKRIFRVWSTLSAEHQREVKAALLDRLSSEPVRLVRIAVANLVSSVLRATIGAGGLRQNDIFACLAKWAADQDPARAGLREAAFVVLRSAVEAAVETDNVAAADLDAIADLLRVGLGDGDFKVRTTAVKGVGALVCCAEAPDDYERLRKILPGLADALKNACVAGGAAVAGGADEDFITAALTVFDDLSELDQFFRASDIPDLARFMVMCVAANKQLELGVRQQAFSFLFNALKAYHKAFNPQLVQEIISMIIPMLIAPDESELEEGGGGDDDTLSEHTLAAQCVDALALDLPNGRVFRPIIDAVSPYLVSQNPWEQRGALTAVGLLSEGCSDRMRGRLEDLLPPVLAALQSPAVQVRSAGAMAFGQFAEYLQPEICRAHATAMPVLLASLDAASVERKERVCEMLCYALDSYTENLHDSEIAVYLDRLLPVLLGVLQKVSGLKAREKCVAALSSAAGAAKAAIAPYVDGIFDVLLDGMRLTEAEFLPLRSRATACAGTVLQSLPPDLLARCRTRTEAMLEQALLGLEKVDSYDVRESSYRFLGCLLYCSNDEFAPLLPRVMPCVFATLTSTEGISAKAEDDDEGAAGAAAVAAGDSDDDDGPGPALRFQVRSAFLDEKEAAVAFLVCAFSNVSPSYLTPWLQPSLEQLELLKDYFHEALRQQTCSFAQSILLSVHVANLPAWAPKPASDPASRIPRLVTDASSSDNRGWAPGLPAAATVAPATLQMWRQHVWPALLSLLGDESSTEVVSDACTAVSESLELLGPELLGNGVDKVLVEQTALLLTHKHDVFLSSEGAGDLANEDDESRQQEEYLFEGVSQVVSALAHTLGSAQFPLATLEPLLRRLALHRGSAQYRTIGIGCYGDLLKAVPGAAAACLDPPLIEAAIACCQSPSEAYRELRNAAYFLGVCCSVGRDTGPVRAMAPRIVKALADLLPAGQPEALGGLRESEWAVSDNALSSLARIIREAPALFGSREAVAELRQTLVPTVLATLPLRADVEEAQNVLLTLVELAEGANQALLEPHTENLLRAVLACLVQAPSLPPELDQRALVVLRNAVTALGADHPVFAKLVAEDPERRRVLAKASAAVQAPAQG